MAYLVHPGRVSLPEARAGPAPMGYRLRDSALFSPLHITLQLLPPHSQMTSTPLPGATTFQRICSAAIAFLLPGATALAGPVSYKNPVPVVPEAHPMYLGTINSGIKTSDAYTDGNFSVVAPLWSTLGAGSTLSGDVLFIEPYVSYGEGGEIASSVGFGWRHLFGSQPISALSEQGARTAGFLDEGVFVGANVFVDMLDTEADNQFWQLGVGLEIGTRYLELRGNYYIPLSDKQLAEETRTRETFRSSRTRNSTYLTGTGDPYATGYSIAQDAQYATYATTTTTTTTIERLFRRYEEGMEGWDAEMALLVPGLDRYFDLRLIGGYYAFDNQPFGPQTGGTGNVEGWKAGVEVRPVPAIILNGTWYEDERLTGSDWTVGVQLQLPFEMGDLGDGKGFWGRIGDAFTPRRRHLVERIAEPVRRQNAAVKIANSVDTETSTSTSSRTRTRLVSQTQTQVVLASDVVFVNNGGPVGNGIQAGATAANGADGTAERPFNSVSAGAYTAGTYANNSGKIWTVYTQGGTGLAYTDNVSVIGSTNFISSYQAISGLDGKIFASATTRPQVNGGFAASSIAYFGITGYDIRNGTAGVGISAREVGVFVAKDNYLQSMKTAISTGTSSGSSGAVITGNRITTAETGILAEATGSGKLAALIMQNEFLGSMKDGIYGYSRNNGSLVAAVTGNLFNGTFESSLGAFESSNASAMQVTVIDNTAASTARLLDDGFQFRSLGSSAASAFVQNNRFLGRTDDSYVEVSARDTSRYTATVSENTFQGQVDGQAVDFEGLNSSTFTASATGNKFDGTQNTAVRLAKANSAIVTGAISSNLLAGSFSGDAVQITANGDNASGSKLTASVDKNVFSGSFAKDGIDANKSQGALAEVNLTNNTFTGGFNSAISVTSEGTTGVNNGMTTLISGNVLSGVFSKTNAEGAVHLIAADTAKLDGTISANIFSGTFTTDAISLRGSKSSADSATNPVLTVAIADNTMTIGASAVDAFLDAQSYHASTVNITGFNRNSVLGTVARALTLREGASSVMTINGSVLAPDSNTITSATKVTKTGTPTGTFLMNGTSTSP